MFLFEKIIIKKLAHVAKNDLNHAHTKTEPVTAGVDATVYCTVTAPAVTVVQFLWFMVLSKIPITVCLGVCR